MHSLSALIFDVDGTLAETERDGHRVAFNQAFAAAGLDWHWSIEDYGQLLSISGGKERIRHFIEQAHPGFAPPTHFQDLTQFIARLHQAKSGFYKQAIATIPLRPGVHRLIQEARTAGLRLAIATTSHLHSVIPLLETRLGLDSPQWFDVIAAGDVVPHKKPAPDIYDYVLAKLQLPPDACLVLEDTHHGLIAATQANLKTIVTVNDYTRGQDFDQALAVLTHLGEPDMPCEVIAGKLATKALCRESLSISMLQKLWQQLEC
ncbi:MAG: HAD family hydrolase [Cyanobacteria bacterium P01_D01_bin.44]